MLQLVFPETPAHDLPLVSDEPQKSLRPKVINSRVVLGEPAAVAITETTVGDDLDLKRFFAAQSAQWAFHAVQLRCSFMAGEGESFERAMVAVQLSAKDGGSGAQPDVYSMSPLKLAQKIDVKQKSSIGSDLKFLKSEIGEEVTVPDNQLYLVAYNEGTANPYWRLKEVAGVTIEGAERFSMIVRVPRAISAIGRIDVSADMRSTRFGLFTCKAPVPTIPGLSFSL